MDVWFCGKEEQRMKITLVPSSVSLDSHHDVQQTSSYVINHKVAIDAGSLGFFGTPHDQAKIKHVLITHTHIDHIASLPIFLDNAFDNSPDCVTIHGSAAVLDCLQRDMFNDRIWPDFIRLSKSQGPFLKLNELKEGQPIVLEGLRFTPISVDHLVPTTGFLVEDKHSAILIVSDTGPTHEIWDRANALTHLNAVFLEAAFPNKMEWLAQVSKHLTPSMFGAEVQKVRHQPKWIAVHIKPRYREEVIKELMALGLPGLEIGRFDFEYQWS